MSDPARRPADHDGVPMCSHLVCPRYTTDGMCLDTGGKAADLCVPEVRAIVAARADLEAALKEGAAAERRSLFARDLGAAAKLVRDVAAGMVAHEAEHSEQMFDDLFELAARLERGRDLMVTNDEWSWG